ncbi:hypothetical protein LINPERPRIM_LOCUS5661 [Linum perenne]
MILVFSFWEHSTLGSLCVVTLLIQTNRITLSLEQSICALADASFLQGYFLSEDKVRLKKRTGGQGAKRKEKSEANLYTITKVARSEDLLEQIKEDIYFDLVDQ